jgi:hypothetical protein
MIYFTTYFDKNYLARGLVLIDSLQKHSESFAIYVLCLDDFTANFFNQNNKKYPQVIVVSLSDIEKSDEKLFSIKTQRSLIEYYFTLSPCLPLYLLKKYNLPHICSLDADIQFYSSPQPLFDYLNEHSIVITPHKFSKEISDLVKWGVNNVSFQIFNNDTVGVDCLELWRKQCLEWCKDELDEENNRFADQKYLDNWNILYPNKVKQLYDNVSGLAPWNLNNYVINIERNSFFSNGEKLIFYHFHHHKFFSKYWASNGFASYKVKHSPSITQIYKDYWAKVIKKSEVFQIGKENFIRQDFDKNLGRTLINEGSVFLRLSNNTIIPINTSNLIIKIALLLYAKIN